MAGVQQDSAIEYLLALQALPAVGQQSRDACSGQAEAQDSQDQKRVNMAFPTSLAHIRQVSLGKEVAASNATAVVVHESRTMKKVLEGSGDTLRRDFPPFGMDRSTPTLRHAGTLAADAGRFAKVEAQLPSQVPPGDAWQLQAAIRTELDRQTRQLEETLSKQAKVALEKHSQEVQGVAAAWQLVARALGEQLQAIRETMENK
eukprot:s1266_g10.t1